MIQFYRWTLSFPPLVGPQNPRAVRLVNKLIGNTTHATCLKAVFGKKDDFGCPQQLTGVLRIFPAVFDFSSVCYIPVQLHQKSDADSYFLKLCPHLFSEGMPHLFWHFVTAVWCPSMPAGCFPVASGAHLTIRGRAAGSKMTEIATSVVFKKDIFFKGCIFSNVYLSKMYFSKDLKNSVFSS